MKNPAAAYRQFSVQSATPLGLVVMLYDGAIAALQRAITAIEAKDIPAKCTHLNRAQAIILQLEGTLNMEVGGEVAKTLKALYLYARGQMLKANIDNSTDILRALIDKISTVREAWYEADRRPSATPNTPARMEAASGAFYEAQPAEPAAPPPTPVRRDSPYASQPPPEPGAWRTSG